MALSNRLKELIDGLDYDFNKFELTHFIQHIGRLKRHEIILVPVPLELGLYAVWIPAETAHYIFYIRPMRFTRRTAYFMRLPILS